jgi:hypothetical protein
MITAAVGLGESAGMQLEGEVAVVAATALGAGVVFEHPDVTDAAGWADVVERTVARWGGTGWAGVRRSHGDGCPPPSFARAASRRSANPRVIPSASWPMSEAVSPSPVIPMKRRSQ